MTQEKTLLKFLESTSTIVDEAIAEMKKERASSEYAKKTKYLQKLESVRNKGFAERGEDWRDVEIA